MDPEPQEGLVRAAIARLMAADGHPIPEHELLVQRARGSPETAYYVVAPAGADADVQRVLTHVSPRYSLGRAYGAWAVDVEHARKLLELAGLTR
jgi:hypothetical protein